jgi:hypothetical protein
LFAGRAGIRGAVPAGLQPGGAFYQQLLGTVHDAVAGWKVPTKPTFRSVFVMANAAGAQREVQAAVDGFVDEKLTDDIRQLSWPTSKEAYFFKQLFVLRHP